MSEQVMLLSSPNSGSDWLAATVCTAEPTARYFREYFNPITNEKHFDLLATEFGCETPSTIDQIVRFDDEKSERIYQETWGKDNFNFTKENYSAFRVPFWTQRFTCFALTRDVENSFRPSRREWVTTFYDAIYNAMLANIDNLPDKTKQQMRITETTVQSLTHKVIMAYVIYQDVLVENCRKHNIPILKWENLMGDEDLVYQELKKVPFIATEAWAKAVLETRSFKKKSFNKYNFNPQDVLNRLKT